MKYKVDIYTSDNGTFWDFRKTVYSAGGFESNEELKKHAEEKYRAFYGLAHLHFEVSLTEPNLVLC